MSKTKQATGTPLRSMQADSILMPVMCRCTWKPYPHSHDNADDPWNFDKTHRFWGKHPKREKVKFL